MTKEQGSPPHFDWGPPAGGVTESAKEWLTYPLLLLLLLGAGWILIDLDKAPGATQEDGGPAAAAPAPVRGSAPVKALPAPTPVVVPPPAARIPARPRFCVQLGAFADEPSAQEMHRKAIAAGFPASLSAPDEQYDMFRLILGPYPTEQEAEQHSRQLQDLDFPSFVIESL